MSNDWQKLQSTWQALGEDDPLWAVASDRGKQGNQWRDDEFLSSAVPIVARYRALLEKSGATFPVGHVLDFGCGAGRLSAAWAPFASKVTGVDISASMLKKANEIVQSVGNVSFVLNERPDLSVFPDQSFDLVFSHICLQHIPAHLCENYLREFFRICRSGGWIAFQLPASLPWRVKKAAFRKFLVELVPFGFAEFYRSRKRGRRTNYDVYPVPVDRVKACFGSSHLLAQDEDRSAGDDVESYIYIFRKP